MFFYQPDIAPPPGIGIRDGYKKMMAVQNYFAKISLTLATPKHCYDPPKQGIWVPWIPLALNWIGSRRQQKRELATFISFPLGTHSAFMGREK